MKIVYLVGSASASSINRQLANMLVELAPEGVEMVEAEIKDLPHYNRDYDAAYPEVAVKFKELLASADGVLFITPEHNRMFSALLHNAIEWSSRPWGQWALAGKPVAVTGTAASGVGTALAQSHLRSTLLFFGSKLMTQPEAYIDATRTGQLEDGAITNETSREVIANFIAAFAQFIEDNK
ncbi:NAD(P)H-dependent oxidoreductase [Trueperella pecoris]|uniref:NAD(P)H-dependent oxidoreductase n=1 Tax=Trueperella pecoris TaxID=2733571 RepID=A0A7M1QYD6_9ACTO|nr:NAD(P)H-dependent oxidoreductase [Trueperella pecoris]QOR46968.1 NAD(P)H-dependent oxidoreductase [Trueperella pecoris]